MNTGLRVRRLGGLVSAVPFIGHGTLVEPLSSPNLLHTYKMG